MAIRRMILALTGSLLLGLLNLTFIAPPLASPPVVAQAQNFGDVVINEVGWSGTTAYAVDEWIELYNNTPDAIDLSNWRLTTADGMNLLLHSDIAPHGYYLIERTDDTTISDIPADWTGPFGGYGLNDDGETITLTNDLGQVIDTANGNGGAWPAGTNNPDYSMERIDSQNADVDANWATHAGMPRNGLDANGNSIFGTPRCRNSVATPAADLVVRKTGPTHVAQGDDVTYTLELLNLGNVPALTTSLTDTLPTGVTYVTGTAPYPVIVDARTLVWTLGDVPIALTPTLITLVARTSPGISGTMTNTITATSAVTEASFDTNIAHWPTVINVPAPILDLVKTGPALTVSNAPLTYHLVISNTGDIVASGVRITDTLPEGLAFVTQTATYPFEQPAADTLVWHVGELMPNVSEYITLTLALDAAPAPTLTNVATATATTGEHAVATWETAVGPNVRLYAVQPGNCGGVSGEAAAIINQGAFAVDLTGWCLDDKLVSVTRTCFPDGAAIPPDRILWLAENADGFYLAWGFDADWATSALTQTVPTLANTWPGFTDDGEGVYLLDQTGAAIDALIYGKGIAEAGWTGAAVPHPYAGYDGKGQVLYRKLDEMSGKPVPDTDTAVDWAQDPNDPTNGRKLRFPGWDLEALFWPVEISATTNLTLAVAPDAMLETVLDVVSQAQHTLIIEGYTLGSVPLYHAINARIGAGVVVTILLESSPAGGLSDQERWGAQQLHRPPNSTVYFMGGTIARYRYQHAKFILVDDRLALISTDNFGENSMPSDVKSNGTMGHRGFVAITDNANVIDYLRALFARDCDPVHHVDVFPYSSAFAPPADFVFIPPLDWTTYTIAFSPTLVTTASHLTLIHAPEHSLRDEDALLGMLNSTLTGTIDVMQLSEPVTWTTGAGAMGLNPRITALIAAAQRGVHVRLLLDAYYDDPTAANTNTAACVYLNRLPLATLQCRLANTTGKGIHAKAFLVDTGDQQWVHLGSINGSEGSNKINRELALQFESPDAHAYLSAVFAYDWERSHLPMIYRVHLPIVLRIETLPADYALITEVFINPEGEDTGREWVEIYNPSEKTIEIAGWSLGDAINVEDYGDGRYLFPARAQLLPRQVIVAAACATHFSARYGFNPSYEWIDCDALVPNMTAAGDWEGFGVALGNVSDEVVLLNTAGVIVDSVAWGGEPRVGVIPFPMDVGSTFPWDASLKRYPPNYDYDDCARDFYISYQPSPGLVGGTR